MNRVFVKRIAIWTGCIALVCVGALPSAGALPVGTLYAKGGATAQKLEWKWGGEQPIVALDFGGPTVGGYAVFKVKSFQAQGVDARGQATGFPVLRLAYATHPDGLTDKGCFTRRHCAHYLGPMFDNPVLPANVNRFETYTITHAGTYVAPLVQGQERYVRVQLDTPGTAVELESVEIRNVGVHSEEPVVGSFRCSDERVNRTWKMGVWTCNLASIPNNDAWRVVDGKLLPRKLERGTEAGLCETAELAGNGSWSVDFSLCANPHYDSAVGLMLCADGKDDGIVVAAFQPAYVKIFRRRGGKMEELAKMVLDRPIVDGVRHVLEARTKDGEVSCFFDGEKIISAQADLPQGGKFGLYVEKEWWPVVHAFSVRDAKGAKVFSDDFTGADAEGRLPGWDYTKSFKFIADGAKRDRLVWIGDLWWAARSCFYGYAPSWPYLRESLNLLCYYQNPEGYVWSAPFAEKGPRPQKGEFGHFPSDEFSAWLVPVAKEYYLYTGDRQTLVETVYPAIQRDLAYLERLARPDGLIEQRIETSSHAASMPPRDPTLRSYTHMVFWKSFTDGAWLATRLGHPEDAARWQKRADILAEAIRKNFWDPTVKGYRWSLGKPAGRGDTVSMMALALGFATPEEALAIAPGIPSNGHNKFHVGATRGKFIYGFDDAAFDMMEGDFCFKISDPKWEGAQCSTECGWMTRKSWWDESHPDTSVSGIISTSLLGIEPTEPGYAKFAFAPHAIRRISFAEGRVPTPHGPIEARWDLKGDRFEATLTVPQGTEATFAFRKMEGAVVDGRPYDGGAIGPGRHAIAVGGLSEKDFVDRSILAGVPSGTSEQWFEVPAMPGMKTPDPEFEFVHRIDLGKLCDVLEIEIKAGKEGTFPREIRVDISDDGVNFKQEQELTGLVWPGRGKTVKIDLRTVGAALMARCVRLRCRKPSGIQWIGDTWYSTQVDGMRLLIKGK